jgi:hypothetical protein
MKFELALKAAVRKQTNRYYIRSLQPGNQKLDTSLIKVIKCEE